VGYIATTTMAFGLLLSTFAGLVYYFGAGSVYGQFDWVPHADLVVGNPGMSLSLGAITMILSVVCRPVRYE